MSNSLIPISTLTEVFESVQRQCNEETSVQIIARMELRRRSFIRRTTGGLSANARLDLKLPLADRIAYVTAQWFVL